jgi:hypothetical protein
MPTTPNGAPTPRFSFHWPGVVRLFLALAVLFTSVRFLFAGLALPEGSPRLDAWRAVTQGVSIFVISLLAPGVWRVEPPSALRPLGFRLKVAAVMGVTMMFVSYFWLL